MKQYDGKIWITTSGQGNSSGINIFDIKTRVIEPIPFQKFLPGNFVIFGLIEISPGEFLINTEKVFIHFTRKLKSK